ncbi:MAG: hypothetical protein WBE76_27035 [Terracidiphilus sp.]
MEPQNLRFGGGAADTVLHPLVAIALVLVVILVLCLPRKHVILPLLLMIFLTPRGQVVVLAGVHFTIARILILAGLARLASSGGSSPLAGGINDIDRAFTLLATWYLTAFSLQWMESQAFIKSLGDFLDTLGGYYVMRFFIRDREEIRRAIKALALVAIIAAPSMINEQVHHINLFGLLGGIPMLPAIRNGQVRSQGPFYVYITAGVFGAALVPLLIWLWTSGKSKVIAGLGLISATVMVLTSHSSTPLSSYLFAIVGLCFWPLRRQMRTFRRALALTLIALHLVMKAPVWALIARVDLTGSSTSYQRFMLIDNSVRHFWDWWFLGCKDYNTWGFDMWDLGDQYVAYAVTGGLLSLVLFIRVISCGFGQLGTARKRVAGDRAREWSLWCIGAALLAYVVAYFGIGNFDQMQFAWYALLAFVSAAVGEAMRPSVPQGVVTSAPNYQVDGALGWGALKNTL